MEYKHFSHHHGLTFYQLQQSPDIRCSGCKSPASGSLYLCWQCSFFLHEQCFHASRSITHPSHPSHPLTLVPQPTYPSASFICNSCNLVGTGFSFSCANCEFDLHVQCAYMPQTPTTLPSYPNVHHELYHSPPNQTPTFNSQYPYMPPNATHHQPSSTNVSNPTQSYYNDTPIFYAQHSHTNNPEANTHQSLPNAPPLPPQSSSPQMAAPPTPPANQGTHVADASNHNHNRPREPEVNHFSHHHPLRLREILAKDELVCSGCEQELSGLAYRCAQPNCSFQLHRSCFGLPPLIQHDSHPQHSLTLLSSPAYKEQDEFTCNACLRVGSAFTYHCSACKYDLHVGCSSIAETVKREDHQHPLALFYSSPYKKAEEDGENTTIFVCDVCKCTVDDRSWVYCCQSCDYGTHIYCVTAEELQGEAEEESPEVSALAAQLELQRLQLQMEMAQQTAQLIMSMGQSISNLATS